MKADNAVWENQPGTKRVGSMYRVTYHTKGTHFDNSAYAYLLVYEDGLTELWDWYWYGSRDPRKNLRHTNPYDKILLDAKREVWEWLETHELVECRRVDETEREYFATQKLKGYSKDVVING